MMFLGPEIRNADQSAELEFRDSMEKQLEEANRKLQTQIDDARAEAAAAKREARFALFLSIVSTVATVIALFR